MLRESVDSLGSCVLLLNFSSTSSSISVADSESYEIFFDSLSLSFLGDGFLVSFESVLVFSAVSFESLSACCSIAFSISSSVSPSSSETV